MAITLVPVPHLSLTEIEMQIKQTRDTVLLTHLQVIKLKLQRKPTGEIVSLLGYTGGWIRKLIHRYNTHGLAGLKDQRITNGGNRTLLTRKQQEELLHILKTTKPADGGLWTGPKVTAWIEKTIGREIRIGTGWDYLTRLGFSLKVPRPHHTNTNPHEQEAFKKKL